MISVFFSAFLSHKLDWATLPWEEIDANRRMLKLDNGLLVVAGKQSGAVNITDAIWGTWGYRGNLPAIPFGATFIEPPVVNVTVFPKSGSSFMVSGYTGAATPTTETQIPANTLTLVRGASGNNVTYEINFIALGRWK